MEQNLATLSLETLSGGGAIEMFNRELDRVLRNVGDPNTDPEEVRGVSIEMLIKPAPDRESGVIQVRVKAKLAPPKPLKSQVFIGQRDGEPVAVTYDPRQSDMFRSEADADGVVTPIRKGARDAAG